MLNTSLFPTDFQQKTINSPLFQGLQGKNTVAPDPTPIRMAEILSGIPSGDIWSLQDDSGTTLSKKEKGLAVTKQKRYSTIGRKKYKTGFSLKQWIGSRHIIPRRTVKLPEGLKTTQLSDSSPIDLNSLTKNALNGALDITLPISNPNALDIAIQSGAKINDTNPESNPQIVYSLDHYRKAGILTTYGVRWSIEKTARDLLQNFADGHGNTLDGVTFKIKKLGNVTNPKYEILIEGLGEYSHELLEDIGGTTKQDKDNNSGGFGEGAKIMSLVMLRDNMAEEIEFSSRNWAYDFNLGKSTDIEGRPLQRRLRIVEDKPGNHLRIVTQNQEFVTGLIQSINYFRHSLNPDYFQLTYENAYGGFTYHGPKTFGNLYIVNQRTEYMERNNWHDSISEFTLWTNIKEKLRDRDRSQVSEQELRSHIRKITHLMKNQDILSAIFTMKDSWPGTELDYANILLQELVNRAREKHLKISFPPDYISHSNFRETSDSLAKHLSEKGYKICPKEFGDLGMETIGPKHKMVNYKEVLGEKPYPEEIIRLNILKRAAELLSSPDNYRVSIDKKTINKPIYIYGNNSSPEDFNPNSNAKLLNVTKISGWPLYWVKRDFLMGDFATNLAAYLKVLRKTSNFNNDIDWLSQIVRMLTDVNTAPQARQELTMLKSLWAKSVQQQRERMATEVTTTKQPVSSED